MTSDNLDDIRNRDDPLANVHKNTT